MFISNNKLYNLGEEFLQVTGSKSWDFDPNNPDIRGPFPFITTRNWSNFRNGIDNPYWKSEVKGLQSASTPANGFIASIDSKPFVDCVLSTITNTGFFYRMYYLTGTPASSVPSSIPFNTAPSDVIDEVTARAYTSFLNKCTSAMSSFESGQDIGELRQTIEGVLHPMKSLRQHVVSYFDSLKKVKRKYKNPVGLRKALSDTYLEWTFGWNPLAADIGDGIAGLTNIRLPTVPVEGFAKKRYSGASFDTSPIGPPYVAWTQNVTSEFSIRLKGMVFTKNGFGAPALLQELRLLPTDFAPTAWDLLPYSFVADYFANIGDIISAYSFPSANIAWINRSIMDKTSMITSYKHLVPDSWAGPTDIVTKQFTASNLSTTSKTFSRDGINPANLIPPLVFNIPLSSKPWENIAALISGRKKSLIPFF